MPDENRYWKRLASTGFRLLQQQGNADAAAVIKNATLEIEYNAHDNWDGGIDYWDLVFQLKFKDFAALGDKKDKAENDIHTVLEQIQTDGRNRIANILIQPALEQYIDWKAALPATKESVIQIIQDEQKVLIDVATGKTSFKEDGVEETYWERHQRILAIANRAGFDYPVKANTLAEWWSEVRGLSSYAERREYISEMFSSVLTALRESDDNDDDVGFHQIASKSGTVQKAVEDAEIFIREKKFDSAVDRVHTAFHGYLRQLLTEHRVAYGAEEGITALYTKLHGFYAAAIQPHDVGERIKTILRSAGGMINAVNELRNNNTIAHPNGQLIQAREAQLVIRLVNAVVDYIEDVENSLIGE